ncbi:MAG: hypothetical protein U0795_08300 [Pirellulales bacterium]
MSNLNPYHPPTGGVSQTSRADFEREFRAYQHRTAWYGFASMGLTFLLLVAVAPLQPAIEQLCLDWAGPSFGEVLAGLAPVVIVLPVAIAFFTWMAVGTGRPALRCGACRRRLATGHWEFKKVQQTGRCPHCQAAQFPEQPAPPR